MIIVSVACKDHDEAVSIARVLLEKRLAAGAHIFPIESLYVLKNAVVDDTEIMLWVETLRQNYKAVRDEIEKLNRYDTPCVVAIKVNELNGAYQVYLKKVVKKYYGKTSPLAKPNLKAEK